MKLTHSIINAAPQHFWLLTVIGVLLTGFCFYLTFKFFRRSRIIADTPTSKIRSAAQGYIELEGKAEMMPGLTNISPLTGQPCPWYSYKIEKRHRKYDEKTQKSHWVTIEHGISDAIFHLKDDTGICIIDPEGANVTPSVSSTWYGHFRNPESPPPAGFSFNSIVAAGEYRYTEKRIQPGDYLYAIGSFISSDNTHHHHTISEETRELLKKWKNDQESLLINFDSDKNGEIDLKEWELAREQAKKEVMNERKRQAIHHNQYHVLKKPQFGRPFLLSTVNQHKMIFNLQLYAALSAIVFICLGSFLSWAIATRLNELN